MAGATCSAQTGGALGCAECGGGADTCDVDPLAAGAITTIWDWVNQLNAASFAGHMGWRVPEIGELQTILDCGFSPCIDPIFGSTSGDYYWSGTDSNMFFGVSAWAAGFGNGDVNGAPAKGNEMHVRAVR